MGTKDEKDDRIGTCEDPRLEEAGYVVCGSAGDTKWHWSCPQKIWRDGYRDEYSAVNDALEHLFSKSP